MENYSRAHRARVFLSTEYGIATVFFVGLGIGLTVMGLLWGFDGQGIRTEATGFLFDIALFGMLVAWFRSRWEKDEQARRETAVRTERIQRYKEELEDIAMWRAPESYFRKVGIRKRLREFGVSVEPLSLRQAELSNEVLSEADLIGANLFDAKLQQTNLSLADLREANLCGADLRAAHLWKANLSGALLINADLSGASLL